MASKDDDREEYDRRLKKLMQECLPGILADVVEERPADPIEFIAHALYKYKNEVPPTVTTLTSAHSNLRHPYVPLQTPQDRNKRSHLTKSLPNRTSSAMPTGFEVFNESDDDFIEMFDDMDFTPVDNPSETVHDSMLGMFKLIGDLFNDEDLL